MLTNLGAINQAMIKLDRQPLFVRVFDPDMVTPTNVGRQGFSTADIGENKASILVTRVNRFYGTQWAAIPYLFDKEMLKTSDSSNITISCVDSVLSRKAIREAYPNDYHNQPKPGKIYTPYYWMDIGNSNDTGQIIFGTFRPIKQPEDDGCRMLPTFFDEFPKVKDNPEEPSCSMAESLARQDLFINKLMATLGANMLWQLLKNFSIDYRGIYLNLKTLQTRPIPV